MVTFDLMLHRFDKLLLIFLSPQVKVKGPCYFYLLLSQQLLKTYTIYLIKIYLFTDHFCHRPLVSS